MLAGVGTHFVFWCTCSMLARTMRNECAAGSIVQHNGISGASFHPFSTILRILPFPNLHTLSESRYIAPRQTLVHSVDFRSIRCRFDRYSLPVPCSLSCPSLRILREKRARINIRLSVETGLELVSVAETSTRFEASASWKSKRKENQKFVFEWFARQVWWRLWEKLRVWLLDNFGEIASQNCGWILSKELLFIP